MARTSSVYVAVLTHVRAVCIALIGQLEKHISEEVIPVCYIRIASISDFINDSIFAFY